MVSSCTKVVVIHTQDLGFSNEILEEHNDDSSGCNLAAKKKVRYTDPK